MKSDLQASFNTIRVGYRYKLVNYGETVIFEVLEILSNDDCKIRSVDTLEVYRLSDLVRYGKGQDFEFAEI